MIVVMVCDVHYLVSLCVLGESFVVIETDMLSYGKSLEV